MNGFIIMGLNKVEECSCTAVFKSAGRKTAKGFNGLRKSLQGKVELGINDSVKFEISV